MKITLSAITKSYNDKQALAETSLEIADGEFVTLLGPSGSGKTTILNLVAGMARASSGRIHIGDRDVTMLDASKREIGMVFQHYALMPHLSVFDNIAFPLRVRKQSRAQIEQRVTQMLELIRLPDLRDRRPAELSGGQQQRVAIARCLAYDPRIILMDEPLGALDRKLREELQFEIKRLHASTGVTMLYVTHDQDEALTMSDRIVLMNHGRVEQVGTPAKLYRRPTSLFAATFLGDSNLLPGRVLETNGTQALVETASGRFTADAGEGVTRTGQDVTLLVRPEHVSVASNGIPVTVVETIAYGGTTRYVLQLADGQNISMRVLGAADGRIGAGDRLAIGWAPNQALAIAGSAA